MSLPACFSDTNKDPGTPNVRLKLGEAEID
jgi:hypothetical protein